jgi:hypothetical protein
MSRVTRQISTRQQLHQRSLKSDGWQQSIPQNFGDKQLQGKINIQQWAMTTVVSNEDGNNYYSMGQA